MLSATKYLFNSVFSAEERMSEDVTIVTGFVANLVDILILS